MGHYVCTYYVVCVHMYEQASTVTEGCAQGRTCNVPKTTADALEVAVLHHS
jgi:hypothetical protein